MVGNTDCCYFAAQHKNAYIQHGDRLGEAILLFCTYESDISFICIDADVINGITTNIS
jgi:hypothetical protein